MEIIDFFKKIIDFYIVAHDLAELSSPRSFLGRFLGIFLEVIILLVFCFFLLFQVPSFIVSFLLRELPLTDVLVVDSVCFPSS